MDNENRLEVEDLTLPRPNIQSPESDAHAAEMQVERRRILGDRYEDDRAKLLAFDEANRQGTSHPEDASVGTPPDKVEEDFRVANEFKARVVERTRELLSEPTANRAVQPQPNFQTESDASLTGSDSADVEIQD